MYSRKIALSLAKQYRTCPPSKMEEDPSRKTAWESHRAVCPYCSGMNTESRDAWGTLAHEMETMYSSVEVSDSDAGTAVRPGQFRLVRAGAGVWRENYFYTPPMVLIIKITPAIPGAILVAQTYHDIQMAAPGDLILTADDSALGPLFVECWNIYTLKEGFLGPPLDAVPERIVEAVRACEDSPGISPEWAVLPRPLAENDPRIFFRELELEVAYTFSSQSVSQLVEGHEARSPNPGRSSTDRFRRMIRSAAPGTRWKRAPLSPEEAFAMAELPVENLPLAADMTGNIKTANLVRMVAGSVDAITPVRMELHGQSGHLTLSGRVHLLPGEFHGSRLVCFLDPEDGPPVLPVSCEWNEETGDFMVEFSFPGDIPWYLRAAVVLEAG